MNSLKLKILQRCAVENAKARICDATASLEINEVNCLHIAANMSIDETTKSLIQILEYKKELAKEMLRTSDKKYIDLLADEITYADKLIMKILGIYTT
jgi:hypothetical protein